MHRLLLILTLAAAAPSCAFAASDQARAEKAGPEAVAGLTYALQHCSGCHAIGTRGRSPNKASRPFRDIATRYTDVELSERLADLSTGHFRMPPLNVTETDLKTLIAYLRAMHEQRPSHAH